MDPLERRELKRQAWLRLAAQRRRTGLLRGRVVALSMICFAALWSIVFVQMETGNDPVLGRKEIAPVTRAEASTRQEVEATEPRELRPHGEDDDTEDRHRRGEATLDVEPGPEAEAIQPELEEVEPELPEEPLVTSQS